MIVCIVSISTTHLKQFHDLLQEICKALLQADVNVAAVKKMREAIKNNVFGTRCVARAAATAGVETFLLISTDKAVKSTTRVQSRKRNPNSAVKGHMRLKTSIADGLDQNRDYSVLREHSSTCFFMPEARVATHPPNVENCAESGLSLIHI